MVLIGEFNQSTFNKSTFDLRDKSIMTLDRGKVDGFDVVLGSAGFEVAKKDADWIAGEADRRKGGLVGGRRPGDHVESRR